MPNHPPEHEIREGEARARDKDPHGLGKRGKAGADQYPASMPTSDRQATETSQLKDGGSKPAK